MKKMKKISVLMLLFAAIMCIVGVSSYADTTIKGDINKDGKLDEADYELARKYAAGGYQDVNLTQEQINIGDMNGDGKLDLKDQTLIRAKIEANKYELGDINQDGKVDDNDVDFLHKYLAGGYDDTKFGSVQKFIADLNGDGVVNQKDTVVLARNIDEAKKKAEEEAKKKAEEEAKKKAEEEAKKKAEEEAKKKAEEEAKKKTETPATEKDTTVATTKIPQAGIKNQPEIVMLAGVIVALAVCIFLKLRSLRNDD